MNNLQPTRFRGRPRVQVQPPADAPRAKIVQPIAGTNPTENYRGTSSRTWANAIGYLYHGKPWFTYFDVPLMQRDSWIRFLATLWASPFSGIEFEVKATNPEVEGYVRRALNRFRDKSAPTLLRSYFYYGFAPGGIEWQRKGGNNKNVGRWHVDKVRRIFSQDARPLVWAKGGKFAGFMTATTGRVISPYAFWFAGHEESGPLHDEPPVSGAYDDWKEYTSRGGARHSLLTFNRRCAVRPAVMYFPQGQTPISASDDEVPEMYNNKDLALATLEQTESGANVVVPDMRDDKGNRRWEFQPAQPNPDSPGVREYPEWLKKNMAAGVGIPIEIVQAAETGSGWSGRKVPLKAWLSSVDALAGLFFDTFDLQALRQGVYENYGPKADYEFVCKSLAKAVDEMPDAEDPKAPGGGGGQPGGGGGAPPGMQPYSGKRGGSGYLNPQTGRIKYMSGVGGRSEDFADSVLKLEERRNFRRQVRMSATAFVEDEHPRDDGGKFAESFRKAVKKKDHLTAHELTNAALNGSHGDDVKAKVSAALDHNLRERGDTKHRHDSIMKSLAGTLPDESPKKRRGKPIIRTADEQLKNLVEHYAGTEGKKKAGKSDTFAALVKTYGGINPADSAFKSTYSGMKEAIEDGIPLAVFNKMAGGLDVLAETLANNGYMQVPEDRHPADFLLEKIRNKHAAGLTGQETEYQEAQEALIQAEIEAKYDTDNPAELVEALRRGEADARREVTSAILEEYAGESGRSDPATDEPEYDPADDWDRGGDEGGVGRDPERDFFDMAQLGLFDEVDHPRADDGKFTDKTRKAGKKSKDEKTAAKFEKAGMLGKVNLEDYDRDDDEPAKEDVSPHEIPLAEFIKTNPGDEDFAKARHRMVVEEMLSSGGTVSAEVLIDYPDLVKKHADKRQKSSGENSSADDGKFTEKAGGPAMQKKAEKSAAHTEPTDGLGVPDGHEFIGENANGRAYFKDSDGAVVQRKKNGELHKLKNFDSSSISMPLIATEKAEPSKAESLKDEEDRKDREKERDTALAQEREAFLQDQKKRELEKAKRIEEKNHRIEKFRLENSAVRSRKETADRILSILSKADGEHTWGKHVILKDGREFVFLKVQHPNPRRGVEERGYFEILPDGSVLADKDAKHNLALAENPDVIEQIQSLKAEPKQATENNFDENLNTLARAFRSGKPIPEDKVIELVQNGFITEGEAMNRDW